MYYVRFCQYKSLLSALPCFLNGVYFFSLCTGYQGCILAHFNFDCPFGKDTKAFQHHRLHWHCLLPRLLACVGAQLHTSNDWWAGNVKCIELKCLWKGARFNASFSAFISPDPLMEPYPHQFATALFSFLYHLASYDAGGEALVSCGMMEALLKVMLLFFQPSFVNRLSLLSAVFKWCLCFRWSSSWVMSKTRSLLLHEQWGSWTSSQTLTWLPFSPIAAFPFSSAD